MANHIMSSSRSEGLSTSEMLEAVLKKLHEIASAATGGSFVFRGEPRCYSEVSSSLYREYETMLETFGDDGFDIRNVQDEILVEASNYASDLSRQDLLSQLQHYGHPTNLIDFTTDYLVALFLACDGESREHGRLILLDTDTTPVFRLQSPVNRIKAQKSVFISPPSGVIAPDQIIHIPRELKLPMLGYLRSLHEISTQTIYDDIHGFIRNAKTHRSAYMEFHIGGLHLDQGSLDEALEHYNRSIEFDGGQKASFGNRGVTFMRMERYSEAIRDFSEVISRDNRDARAYQERGQAYLKSGQPELAEQDYNEAIRLDNQLEDAYVGRAACRVDTGNHDGAIKDLDRAIELNPASSDAYSGRGAALGAAGEYQSALQDLDVAIEMDASNSTPHMVRTFVYFDLEEYVAAISNLDQYLAKGGEDPSAAHFRRGLALIALGRFDEARLDLQIAVESDSSVASRVIAGIGDTADGSETLMVQEEIPADVLEMLKLSEGH